MKKVIILVVVAAVVAAGALFAPRLADTDSLVSRLAAEMSKNGREVKAGPSHLSLFPLPHIAVERVTIADPALNLPEPAKIEGIEAYLSLGALFSGEFKIDRVEFLSPQLPLELIAGVVTSAPEEAIDPSLVTLSGFSVKEGTLYALSGPFAQERFEHYNAKATMAGSALTMAGTTTHRNKSYAFDISTAVAPSASRPFKATVTQGSDRLALDGTFTAGEASAFSGTVALSLADLMTWTTGAAGQPPVPLEFQAKIQAGMEHAAITSLSLKTTGIEMTGDLEAEYGAARSFKGAVNFVTLDLDALGALPSGASLPESWSGTLNATADRIQYRGLPITGAKASLQLLQGELNINQAVAVFPGNSRLTFLGLVRKNSQGLTLEGSVDGNGDNFKALLPITGLPVTRLPDEDMRRFLLKTNVYLSTKQARLSEAQLRLEQAYFTGALIAYLEGKPRYEAVLKAQNVNADHYLAPFRDVKKKPLLGLFDMGQVDMSWLTGLPFDLTLKAAFEGFTWNGKGGNKADFDLGLSANALTLKNIRATYDGSAIDGEISLEPKPGMPYINATLHFSDWGTFEESSIEGRPEWAEAPFDFTNLKSWQGVFDLSFDQFKAANFSFSALKAKAALGAGKLDVSAVSGRMWQGTIQGAGTLETEGVPKITGTYKLEGIESADALGTVFGLHSIRGRGSVNGSFTTSGVNMKTWISELRGSVGLAGRDIIIDGFDVPMVARGLQAARAVADIVNVTRLAFNGGQTEFNTLSGDIFFERGVGRTNGLSLASDLANGAFTGEISLPDWTMNMQSLFTIGVGAPGEQPTLGVQFTGPINKLNKQFDTSSLEAYVAKKAAADLVR